MRLPLRENISGKKQRQLFAQIVGSELLVHARAPAGKHNIRQEAACACPRVKKHIRQEAEATFCADSWLRASRAWACRCGNTYQVRSRGDFLRG